ncbi:MAG: hypothetical protein V7K59_12605 [Nostoc sp.]
MYRLYLWLGSLVDRQAPTNHSESCRISREGPNDKRDFEHLLRNQSEISKNIAYGFKDIEEQIADQNNELREIKAWLIRGKPISE